MSRDQEYQDIPDLGMNPAAALEGQNEDVPPLDSLTGGFQAPSLEQILSMVETMEGLSDEERSDLKRQLLQQQDGGDLPVLSPAFSAETILLLTAVSLIIFVFVFFGYKLYKSLKEKQRKDERRRLKQQKKKK